MMAASLTLKWGNVKGWDGMEEGHPAREAIAKYLAGAGLSAMERQSTEQRELICSIIDAVDGEIFDDWRGVVMSKEDAKKYVRNYGTQPTSGASTLQQQRNNQDPRRQEAAKAKQSKKAKERWRKINATKKTCRNGHPWRKENLYIKPNGDRCCKTCRKLSALRCYERKKLNSDHLRGAGKALEI